MGGKRLNRGEKRAGEAGAALVEAALVMPVVLLIVFGIIEFGLAFKDSLSVSSATRAGARTASAEPRHVTFADDTAKAVAKAASALPNGSIDELWVYRAMPDGYPDGGSSFASCTECAKYTWDTATQKFVRQLGTDWDPATQNACAGSANHDSVGVYLKVNHTYLTGFFGSNVTLKEHAVMSLEPVPATQGCS